MLVGTTSIEKSEQLGDFLAGRAIRCSTSRAARAGQALRGGPRGHAVQALRGAQRPLPRAGGLSSSPRPACRARSPSPPTWPGAARTSSSAATSRCASPRARRHARGPERDAREAAIRAEVADFQRRRRIAAGGLYIIGTERHESRRIDNQLRGRAGRQGDPGRSKFFLSLQDDLMRIFGSDRMEACWQARPAGGRGDRPPVDQQGAREGAAEGRGAQLRHAQEHPEVRQRHERPAQGRVRAAPRDDGAGLARGDVGEMREGVVDDLVARFMPPTPIPSTGTSPACASGCRTRSTSTLPVADWAEGGGHRRRGDARAPARPPTAAYAARVEKNGADVMRYVEKQVVLQVLDHLWREHLVTLDHLRQVIGWRGFAQRDPLNEYKSEAFDLFDQLIVAAARDHDRAAHARRGGVRAAGAADAADAGEPFRAADRRREGCPCSPARPCPAPSRNGADRARRARLRRRRRAGARPAGSRDLGPGRPQRALPLRLGQEVQALPRRVGRLTHWSVIPGRRRRARNLGARC